MKHKGIAVLAPLALATVAMLGFGQAAQAAPAIQGDTQLVTIGQHGELQHTIRHADGSWQRMGFIPGYGQVNYLTSAIVGGEENVVVEYQTGPSNNPNIQAARLVRHADGNWDFHASLPDIPVNPEPITAVNVNGKLDLVALTPTGPEVSELGANGQWSEFSDVPLGGHLRSIAAVANGNSLRVVALYGDGHTVGVIDRTATGWSAINKTVAEIGEENVATQVAAAQVGDTLQVGAVVNSTVNPDAMPSIAFERMDKAGSWTNTSSVWTYGRPATVSMTPSNGDMQLAYTTQDGSIYHTIRHADDTWQEPGYVQGVAGGGPAAGVTIAG